MIRLPSPPRADSTIEGLEYASDVTHVQWKEYVRRNTVINVITAVATLQQNDNIILVYGSSTQRFPTKD